MSEELPGNTTTETEPLQETPPNSAKDKAPKPASLFEFVTYFYSSKTSVGEKYRAYFKNLDGNLSADELDSLVALAQETDAELGRTLDLAEFVLEESGRQNQRDQIINLVQRIASNVGSLAITESNAVFQKWLDGNSQLSKLLDFFFKNLGLITDGEDKKGNLKKLSGKRKNNLGSIAAIWLYHKRATTMPELIDLLLNQGMNLKGQAGQQIDNRAFAFVASMIKSTNKKKFAYFLDTVRRDEKLLKRRCAEESVNNAQLGLRITSLVSELEQKNQQYEQLSNTTTAAKNQIASLESENAALKEQLEHSGIHGRSDIDTLRIKHRKSMEGLLKTIELAKTALERGQDKALSHQLKEMERTIGSEAE